MAPHHPARLAAVLLAGGASRRFGAANKLLANVDGEALIARVAAAIVQGGVSEIVVVTGAEHDEYVALLAGRPVRIVHNALWADGMGGSVAAGVRALSPDAEGAFIVPGDMPRLTGDVFRALAAAFESEGRSRVIVPVTSAGAQRNPVLWPRAYFPALAALSGPEGARGIITSLGSARRDVAFGDESVFLDIDTGADLARLVPGVSV
jgi:molybdenum cofactor cytidylyltransferase